MTFTRAQWLSLDSGNSKKNTPFGVFFDGKILDSHLYTVARVASLPNSRVALANGCIVSLVNSCIKVFINAAIHRSLITS